MGSNLPNGFILTRYWKLLSPDSNMAELLVYDLLMALAALANFYPKIFL